MIERWQPRLRTARAIAHLCLAQLIVAWIPLKRWRHTLGSTEGRAQQFEFFEESKRLAADVEWAAKRMPISSKCLHRAMALSWMLRRRGIVHAVVVAIRPAKSRQTPDALHAWVEIDGQKIIGDLPDPWIEILRLGP